MPVRHDFKCAEGHVFEATVEWNCESLPCQECGKAAEMVFLSRVARASAFRDPIVVFKDLKTGKYRFPGRSDKATPEGFERVEMRNVPEARKFEQEMNRRGMEERERNQIGDELTWSGPRKQMREELYAKMGSFSNFGKAFARYAIEQSNRGKPRKNYEPGFHIEVLS
jgi:hypothetical protein